MCKHEDHLDILAYLAEMECLRRKRNYLDVRGVPFAYYESRQKALTGPRIKDVIFNDPATIVFWEDGTKTVVKAQNEPFDKEKGLAMAIVKKMYGNKGSYFNEIKKWVEDEKINRSLPKSITIFNEFDAFSDIIKEALNQIVKTNDNNKKTSDKTPYVTIDGSNLYSD